MKVYCVQTGHTHTHTVNKRRQILQQSACANTRGQQNDALTATAGKKIKRSSRRITGSNWAAPTNQCLSSQSSLSSYYGLEAGGVSLESKSIPVSLLLFVHLPSLLFMKRELEDGFFYFCPRLWLPTSTDTVRWGDKTPKKSSEIRRRGLNAIVICV